MMQRFGLLIYLILFILFGIAVISESSQSKNFLYYTILLWLGTGLMLTVSRYIISPRLKDGKLYISLTILVIGIVVSFLAPAYFFAKFQSDIANVDFNASLIVHPIIIKEILPYIILATFIGFIHLIKIKKNTLKKALLYCSSVVILIVVAFFIKYYVDTTYEGDRSTRFIEEDYKTLNAILAEEQFTSRVVYVDLWYSSCAPCIKEFKKLPEMKEELKNNNVEFLYLARQTSHPNSLQLWKNAIKKYDLKGWHVYMTDELGENTWNLIESHTKNIPRAYPHYLIVNKEGKIVSYNAKRPSDGQLLFDQIISIDN